MGIVYLIQPIELVGTDRYKIGCSTKSDLSRITTGYNKGTIPNLVEVVDDPYFVETLLKQTFAERFTLVGGQGILLRRHTSNGSMFQRDYFEDETIQDLYKTGAE